MDSHNTWISFWGAGHGNESSSSDAALVTAYHLLADRREETRKLLESVVVIIDPLQNPDGRERFVNVYRETRGVFPEADPFASEHTERWPGGRFNHYLFDMNRDWFLQSQAESRGKVAAYLHWHPHLYIDAHEMGRDNTYYFDPPMDPINNLILPRQQEWFHRLGRHQAARFDEYGFAYTTREMFDAFYPGYGSTWPTMQGGIGILWEQAGVRGLVIDRSDETKLNYHDAVRHHYISGLATLEVAARHRTELIGDFYQARADAVRLGREGPVRDFFLLPGRAPARAAWLVEILRRNGIEVRVVGKEIRAKATPIHGGDAMQRTIPAGSYHLPVAQPAGRLLRILLDRQSDMGEEFVKKQLDRKARRLEDEIYDVTAWSLPLAFDVQCLATGDAVEVESRLIEDPPAAPAGSVIGGVAGAESAKPRQADEPHSAGASPTQPHLPAAGKVIGGPAKVAYLVSGEDAGVPLALAAWLREGLRVHVADQPLTLADVDFSKGTVILRVPENPEKLHDSVAAAAKRFGLTVHATDTGFVTKGAHLGGPDVRWVKPPKVAMLVDRPASYSVGHTWYLFDQVWRYPVTRVAGRSLASLDLTKYNVLILPDGSYTDGDAPNAAQVVRIKEWVRAGGTLILVKGATAWGAGEKVGLVASKVEKKTPAKKPAGETVPAPPTAAAAAASESSTAGAADDKSAGEPPDPVPGAFLRATVYDDHWVTFGFDATLPVMMNGNLILSPLKPTDGRNLVTFAAPDKLLVSGFCWPDTLKQIADKPYVLYQSLGQGHVIAFTDDPNFRAMYPATQRLFLNGVLFGPGH